MAEGLRNVAVRHRWAGFDIRCRTSTASINWIDRNGVLSEAEDKPMNHAGGRRNQSREWVNILVADNGEAIVAAMTEAGVEFVFFTSGSEIGFYQEAIAKAEAQGRKAPKLIS